MKYLVFCISCIFFIACGGGGSYYPENNLATNSGVFLDSQVQGLRYTTDSFTGYTDINGTFYYKTDEIVKFYIGNIYIGSSKGAGVITPLDLVPNSSMTNATVLNIARVLQTFDIDKNCSNGISLVPEAVNLDSNLTADFSKDSFVYDLFDEVNSSNHNLIEINSSSALEHLQITFDTLTNANDPYLYKQWYLDDLNISVLHKDYNGSSKNGSIIQVVDTGIDSIHQDLFASMDIAKSYNAETHTSQNCTPDINESHGTSCAGIIGARGFNGKGIRGINPLGKLVGFKFHTDNATQFTYTKADLEKAWISGDGANDITVSNNSWGGCYSNSTDEEDILKWGSENLRDGKGRIYVFAAGNNRENTTSCVNASANMSYMLNNPYSITVASLQKDNTYASYSNPGANILVSAYGNLLYTTDLDNKYKEFSGTSAATPVVSGAIGLLLEACPTLTYRDVKYLLATTAIKVDSTNNSWITNDAGLHYSIDYGYGKINISKAIDICKTNYINLPSKTDIEQIVTVDKTVPNNDINGTIVSIDIDENKTVEWVGVWFDADFDNLGEFEFYLISPAGTKVKLLHYNNGFETYDISSSDFELRLSSVAFIDEQSQGEWKVIIADRNSNNQQNRILKRLKLSIIGH